MFKGIIDREGGNPWPETGMTGQKWLGVPVSYVALRDLIVTQDTISLEALIGPQKVPAGGDPHIHVIYWRGDHYLVDGHHRVMRAYGMGFGGMSARVYRVPDNGKEYR